MSPAQRVRKDRPVRVVAALLTLAASGRANGRFPAANQLVVDPDDPLHIVVRATYGTMISHDGGKAFELVCERAIGATGDADPMLGLFSGGTMVAGVVSGLASTQDDGCNWGLKPGIPPNEYVVDVTVQKDDPRQGLVVSSTATARDGSQGFDSVLFETTDGAATFRRIGAPLGKDFLAQTVEVAPSDRNRVYVSGIVSERNGVTQTPTVVRSSDRGKSFSRSPLSSFGVGYSAWISAVDPKNPAIVYVRIRHTDDDRLWVSRDGAMTFDEVYRTTGSLTGFALSPDGSEVAIGGDRDGIQIADTKTFRWRRTSEVHAQCLTWTKSGIYACGVEWIDHFLVGFSQDHGKTFAPLTHIGDPCARKCMPNSTVDLACTLDIWRGIQVQIGQGQEACGGQGAESVPEPQAASRETKPRYVRLLAGIVAVAALITVVIRRLVRRRRRRGAGALRR